jgi:glycosyltransferase involved in cell wall biosynthesis
MADGPEVAVVIGAYQRDRFLLSAVRSVLAQTLSRERYEVVVTKSFAHPEIDRFLADQAIPSLRDDDPRIGTWLLRAVGRTRAPYVAFLDDDDEFAPERLACAVAVLRSRPELGFYRNRVSVIDERGNAVPRNAWRSHEVDGFFERSGPVTILPNGKSDLAHLGLEQSRASFNSSTMVVRRELFEGELGAAFARTQLPDLALFVLAAVSRFGLYLDDRRLTRYRYYPGNVTHRTPWLRHAREAYRDLAGVAHDHANDALARLLLRDSEHYDRLYRSGTIVARIGDGAPRGEVARLGEEYLRFLGGHPAERAFSLDVWAATMYAGAYLLVPGLARRVSLLRTARRRA